MRNSLFDQFQAASIILLTLIILSVVPSSIAYTTANSNSIIILAKHQVPWQITISGGYIYWANNADEINRVPVSGGRVQTIISTFYENEISGFAVSNNFVFWGTGSGYLHKTDLSNNHTSVFCRSGRYCSDSTSLQVSGNYVFFISPAAELLRINTDGSHLQNITPQNVTFDPQAITLSSGYVYWSNPTGQVGKVSFSGKDAELYGPNLCGNG